MRRYLLAAVAAVAIATPALARDGSPYVGIEAGILIPEDFDFDVDVLDGTTNTRYPDGYRVNLKNSYEADILAGYDFGLIRVEGELAYKRLRTKDARTALPATVVTRLGLLNNDFDISEKGSILSLMANALVDVGNEDGFTAYLGGGLGRARVRLAGDRDSAFAKQLIAGVRYAITPNVDIGLKYRYFRTSKVNFDDSITNPRGTFGIGLSDKIRTHSVLATLAYNFYTPAPPPVVVEPIAPPPPPPATQTCYDGSVILATDVCPQPPVEALPPPPVAAPERG